MFFLPFSAVVARLHRSRETWVQSPEGRPIFHWGFSSSGRAVDSHSTGRGIDAPNLQVGRRDGVVNVTDSKSVPFGGAGSNPADVSFCRFVFLGLLWYSGSMAPSGGADPGSIPGRGSGGSRSSVGRSSASHAEGPGFDPLRELAFFRFGSRKVVRSIRAENSSFPAGVCCPIWCSR